MKIPAIEDYAAQLPGPAEEFFIAFQRDPMLIVRHSDGVPVLTIDHEGNAHPYELPPPSGQLVMVHMGVQR